MVHFVILLIIVFVQFKLAVMHQCNHFVCLYLKTWRVGFLLFPSPIPFKFQNLFNSDPAQSQQVLLKISGCRTYVLHIEFFFQKVCTPIIITIFNLIFSLFTIIKSYNLFKTLRTTHKNPLTLEIQTNQNKKKDFKQGEFDNLVHSIDQAKYSDRKLRIESVRL